jgi:hypothetical protein
MPFDPTNRGALFKNDKKGNPARPDYTGDCNVEGVEYRLSAWTKQSKGGLGYLSLSFQRKDGQKPPAAAMPKVANGESFVDDELPPF